MEHSDFETGWELYLMPDAPEGEMLHYGVRGMKWGIRRSSAQLKSAAAKRGETPAGDTIHGKATLLRNKKTGDYHEIGPDGKPGKVVAKAADIKKDGSVTLKEPPAGFQPDKKVVGAASGETSTARYNRLREQARTQGANSLDEQDLKFMNARADAIAKVQKMNETQPGWLSTTTKKVLQQTAQNGMQDIADGVRKKYITGPVLDAINKK